MYSGLGTRPPNRKPSQLIEMKFAHLYKEVLEIHGPGVYGGCMCKYFLCWYSLSQNYRSRSIDSQLRICGAHTLTVLSSFPVAMNVPSGLQHTASTYREWPCNA